MNRRILYKSGAGNTGMNTTRNTTKKSSTKLHSSGHNSHTVTYKSAEHFAYLLTRRPVNDARLQFSYKELVCHVQLRNAVEDDVDVSQLKYTLCCSNTVSECLHILQQPHVHEWDSSHMNSYSNINILQHTGWLKIKCPTGQNAISRQPIETFLSKFQDL